jgi:hypothetical protein
MNKYALLRGMRAQLRKDDDPYRRAIFRDLLTRSRPTAALYSLCAKISPLGALACFGYYTWIFLSARIPANGEILAIPKLSNERRTLAETLDESLANRIGRAVLPRSGSVRTWFRLLSICRILARNHELFLALRMVEVAAYLHRLDSVRSKPRLVISTTDGNPSGIALLEYARARNIRAAFLSHGEPNSPVLPISCDVAYLLGESSRERYASAGARIGRTILRGHRDHFKAVQGITGRGGVSRLLIAMGKVEETSCANEIISWARREFRGVEIVARPHPSFPLTREAASQLERQGVVVRSAKSLSEEIVNCDLAVAGNSTSHLEIILAGVPSLYFFHERNGEFDRYGYLRDGLILAWQANLTTSQIDNFYSSAELTPKIKQHLSCEHTFQESRKLWNDALHTLLKPKNLN